MTYFSLKCQDLQNRSSNQKKKSQWINHKKGSRTNSNENTSVTEQQVPSSDSSELQKIGPSIAIHFQRKK